MIDTYLFNSIVQKVQNFKPEKIILFGSNAYGNPDQDSDIDLLIIKNINPLEVRDLRIQIRKALRSITDAGEFDIIVDSQKRINQRIRIGDLFLKDITEKGKVIYAE
jgi:uncharacterized protein